jgi:hypothetical protein
MSILLWINEFFQATHTQPNPQVNNPNPTQTTRLQPKTNPSPEETIQPAQPDLRVGVELTRTGQPNPYMTLAYVSMREHMTVRKWKVVRASLRVCVPRCKTDKQVSNDCRKFDIFIFPNLIFVMLTFVRLLGNWPLFYLSLHR